MMAPAYQAAARELEPQVRLIKVNSDAQQGVASRLGIQGIPTMVLFHQGREIARRSGALSATQIVRWVRENSSPSMSELADGPDVRLALAGKFGPL